MGARSHGPSLDPAGRAELADPTATENDRLLVFLSSPPSEQDYAALGHDLGLGRGAVAARVGYRLRQRYRALVRQQIAQTVIGEEELRQEMQYLITLLSR